MILGLSGYLQLYVLFIVNLIKCQFLLISYYSGFLLVLTLFPLEISEIISNLHSSNLLCFRICSVRICVGLLYIPTFLLSLIKYYIITMSFITISVQQITKKNLYTLYTYFLYYSIHLFKLFNIYLF